MVPAAFAWPMTSHLGNHHSSPPLPREKREINDVYLMRVEQLYPFPLKALVAELSRFKSAEIVWCQEEPKNMGAWSSVEPYLEWVMNQLGRKGQRTRYIGRAASAATATGVMSKHIAQLQAFLDEAYADAGPRSAASAEPAIAAE